MTPVTPQNVILTQDVITIAAKCNNINAKCSKVINAECNNFPAQNVISFLTQNVITQIVITLQLQVCLTWSIFFFSTRTSEQHTATADTDFVREFEQDSVETYFIADGYSTNHVLTRVRNINAPTKT